MGTMANRLPPASFSHPEAEAVLAYLEAHFPNRLPTNYAFEDREVAFRVGQQSVIDHLRTLLRRKDALTT